MPKWWAGGSGGGSGGGGMTLIASSTLAAAGATIDFSSIPQTYKHLRLLFTLRSVVVALFDSIGVRVNGDSGTHYDGEFVQGSGATVASASNLSFSSWTVNGAMPGASATAGIFNGGSLDILDYTNTSRLKSGLMVVGFVDGANEQLTNNFNLTWHSTAAINEVTLQTASAHNLDIGSSAWLYGI